MKKFLAITLLIFTFFLSPISSFGQKFSHFYKIEIYDIGSKNSALDAIKDLELVFKGNVSFNDTTGVFEIYSDHTIAENSLIFILKDLKYTLRSFKRQELIGIENRKK